MSDERTAAFLRVLDPGDNSTGGGSASAIAGGMAAALAALVARLSLGRDGDETDAAFQDIAEAGARLSAELIEGAEEDARAFDAVMAAYHLPKTSEAQKHVRSEAIQAAMTHATQVPLRNAERCAEVIALAAQLEGRSNPNALSDLLSAEYLARAGLRGCLANVDINLSGIKDSATAGEIRARAESLRPLAHRPEKD